jgi:hypothetical protein
MSIYTKTILYTDKITKEDIENEIELQEFNTPSMNNIKSKILNYI